MLYFSLGLGALLFLIGLATYFLAPRVGPNPIFGVRIGYAFATREVWDRTNRFGGILMALVGLGVMLLGLLFQAFHLDGANGITALTAVMMLALVGSVVWMFFYSRGLALGTAVARQLTPVRFRWAYLAPVLAAFALLAAAIVYLAPQLPPELVASHFNLYDQPDGWTSRGAFLSTFLGLGALFVVLDGLLVFFSTREPIIAFGRWGSTWRLDPEQGLIFTGIGLALVELILLAVLYDVVWFNTHGAHLFPLSSLFPVVVAVVVMVCGLFFALARREPYALRE